MNKHHNLDIIHDVSLLYELSLAIGTSFELRENIHNFVRVLMARKNIDIVNVWLKASFLDPSDADTGYRMAYSNPRFRITTEHLPAGNPVVEALSRKPAVSVSYLSPEFQGFVTEQGIHNGVYTAFRLGDIGFIKFYQFARRYKWEQTEMNKLEKVISRFTQSIMSCVHHYRTLEETERRMKTEKALQEREQQFLNLVNTIEDVFWVYDTQEQQFQYVSPAIERLLEIAPGDLKADAAVLKQRLAGDDKEAIFQRIIHTTQHPTAFSVVLADGTTRWLQSSGNPGGSDGDNKRIAGIFSDITRVKEAAQEREYRLAFEQILLEISTEFINIPAEQVDRGISDALARIGAFAGADRSYVFQFHDNDTLMSNTYEWCSDEVVPEMEKLQDLPSDTFPWWIKKLANFESIYLPTLEHLPPEAIAEREILEAQEIRSLIVLPLAIRGQLKGFIGFDFVKAYATFSEDTIKMLRFVGQMIMNTLDNKEKNYQLRLQEQRYQSIVESATDIIYRIDHQGRFIFTNEKTLEITGFSQQELMGMDYEQIVHPNYVANISRFYRDQFRKRIENTYLEFPVVNRFGDQVWIGQNASLSIAADKTPELTMVARDITDIINANASLKEAYNKAERASQSKTQFVVNTSHEIRTPVHAVGGLIGMLEKTNLDSEQKKLIKKLKSTSKSLNTLVDNVIDFKKIESETMDIRKEPFNIHELLQALVEMLRFTAEENNVTLSYEVDKRVKPNLIADVGKLQRILINLAGNAIKFNKDGSANIAVKPPEDHQQEAVVFEITDTGIGMDEEFIKSVHREFDQKDNTTTRRYEGSGLGLYISLELLRIMGSKARITSSPEAGTRIAFTLPVESQKDEEPAREEQAGATESKKTFPHLHMLIAEDNKINQLVASRALKTLQVTHDIAANGKEAVEMVRKTDYDAILMDLMMPEMDGFEATITIRKDLKKEMPIIACTAKKVKGTIEECFEAGMDAYITKPFNESDIRNKLNLLRM